MLDNKTLNEEYLHKKPAFFQPVTLNHPCHPELVSGSHTKSGGMLKQVQHDMVGNKKAGFSLVELLMALLVASLLMAALAPVMTRKFGENVNITGNMTPAGTIKKTIELEYNSNDCSDIKTDSDGSQYCEGEFEIPGGYNGYMNVTVIGAGGGGGSAPTAGYTEYTTAGSHSFPVPFGINQIEATIVEGGAGGGAGYIDPNIKGYAWTHTGTLNRTYVSTSDVSANVQNIKLSGETHAATYTHATGTLGSDVIKNVAGDKLFITLSGGGGGGGRGYGGSGGGGGAVYKRQSVTINKGNSYDIKVGAGGRGHTCNGAGGCGGSASSFGGLLSAGGGGGGGWPMGTSAATATCNATNGENGGSGAVVSGAFTCQVAEGMTVQCTGGLGANPGGQTGVWTTYTCNGVSSTTFPGGNGGNSIFGTGGIYNTIVSNYDVRTGRGYGSGGSGGGGCPECIGHGAPGFVAAEWLNLGNGGSGGGGGSIMPLRKIAVIPNEALTVIVGKGGAGGASGSITNSITSYTQGGKGKSGNPSYLKRENNNILGTSLNTPDMCNCGACGGAASGQCDGSTCCTGWIAGCGAVYGSVYNPVTNELTNAKYPGFIITRGKTAGNQISAKDDTAVYTIDDKGGDGGNTTIFGKKTCESGKGSTTLGTAGGNATGYGGCGGGGGYGLAKGGDGAPGYARISWNKYWDTATNAYKNAGLGAAGGGASGNIFTYSIAVKSNQVIKYRIGKGGSGAYISNNTLTNAKNGGMTVFGDLKAGGGGGGGSVSIDSAHDNNLLNGTGGIVSNVCHFGGTSYLNNKKCTKGSAGSSAINLTGGGGANFIGFKYIVYTKEGDNESKIEKTVSGTGGMGGVLDTGDNANGKDTTGYASGGGGAALRDIGQVNSSSAGNITNNPNHGGKGGNGKIIIEWWE